MNALINILHIAVSLLFIAWLLSQMYFLFTDRATRDPMLKSMAEQVVQLSKSNKQLREKLEAYEYSKDKNVMNELSNIIKLEREEKERLKDELAKYRDAE